MATGGHLKIKSMGDYVLGVALEGNPRKPEPIHFRVMFPGGDIDIVRTTDGDNWVHLRVNHPEDGWDPERVFGVIESARLDIIDKHSVEVDLGDFENPGLYHASFLVKRK